VKRERVNRLSAIERELAQVYYRSLVGRPLEVLVERLAENRPGWVRGTDRRYVPVELPGTAADVGSLLAARGTAACEHFLEGRRE
jgi:threonylcarbamoyladenosine tRNA methylthiotransferase MtaB